MTTQESLMKAAQDYFTEVANSLPLEKEQQDAYYEFFVSSFVEAMQAILTNAIVLTCKAAKVD